MEGTIPQQFNKNKNISSSQVPNPNEAQGTIEIPKMSIGQKLQEHLDKYIQECLNKYKPVEDPDESLYENTSKEDQDLIISYRSTIPDLVIWNKKFNKNECFVGADANKKNDFPRYRFYLRLGNKDKNNKNKNDKKNNEKNKDKKNKKNKKNKKDKNNKNFEDNNNNVNKEGINNITNSMNNMNLNDNNNNDINNNINNINNGNK